VLEQHILRPPFHPDPPVGGGSEPRPLAVRREPIQSPRHLLLLRRDGTVHQRSRLLRQPAEIPRRQPGLRPNLRRRGRRASSNQPDDELLQTVQRVGPEPPRRLHLVRVSSQRGDLPAGGIQSRTLHGLRRSQSSPQRQGQPGGEGQPSQSLPDGERQAVARGQGDHRESREQGTVRRFAPGGDLGPEWTFRERIFHHLRGRERVRGSFQCQIGDRKHGRDLRPDRLLGILEAHRRDAVDLSRRRNDSGQGERHGIAGIVATPSHYRFAGIARRRLRRRRLGRNDHAEGDEIPSDRHREQRAQMPQENCRMRRVHLDQPVGCGGGTGRQRERGPRPGAARHEHRTRRTPFDRWSGSGGGPRRGPHKLARRKTAHASARWLLSRPTRPHLCRLQHVKRKNALKKKTTVLCSRSLRMFLKHIYVRKHSSYCKHICHEFVIL
jgi:hypothetical protein